MHIFYHWLVNTCNVVPDVKFMSLAHLSDQ